MTLTSFDAVLWWCWCESALCLIWPMPWLSSSHRYSQKMTRWCETPPLDSRQPCSLSGPGPGFQTASVVGWLWHLHSCSTRCRPPWGPAAVDPSSSLVVPVGGGLRACIGAPSWKSAAEWLSCDHRSCPGTSPHWSGSVGKRLSGFWLSCWNVFSKPLAANILIFVLCSTTMSL